MTNELNLLLSVMDTIPDLICLKDTEGRYILCNKAFERYFGASKAQLSGRTDFDFKTTETAEAQRKQDSEILEKGESSIFYEWITFSESGETSLVETIKTPMKDESGRLIGILSISKDVTEQKVMEEKLREVNLQLLYLSDKDALTGLANRRKFNDHLDMEWHHAVRRKESIALIMLDIDKFKQYNDAYGHLAGDQCLYKIGTLMSNIIKRHTDLAARYGGEEFGIVLGNIDEHHTFEMAERVRKGIFELNILHSASSYFNSRNEPVVTVSIGAAVVIPKRNSEPEELILLADQALYKAKADGRNRTVLYTPENS
ncbi:MAG TPA: diguanylate cyclase [Leptospiraceae bacterium]|nr:diguanylate cyclase [Leptospiraceae bacterium]